MKMNPGQSQWAQQLAGTREDQCKHDSRLLACSCSQWTRCKRNWTMWILSLLVCSDPTTYIVFLGWDCIFFSYRNTEWMKQIIKSFFLFCTLEETWKHLMPGNFWCVVITCFIFQKYQQSGFPVTDLHEFLKDCGNVCYRKEQASMPSICCCRRLVGCFWWELFSEVHQLASHYKVELRKCWSTQSSAHGVLGLYYPSRVLLGVRSLVCLWWRGAFLSLNTP